MVDILRNILILVFVHAVASQRYPGKCGLPTKYPDRRLDDKYLHTSEFRYGDKVAYNCAPGYVRMEGSRISHCKMGHWTPLNMKCDRKSCGPLSDFENGKYLYTGVLFGDKATAVCNEGYVLRGEGVRSCTEDGWNGAEPICDRGGATRYVPPELPVSVASAHQMPCGACNPSALPADVIIQDPKPCFEDGDQASVMCNTGYSGHGSYICKGGKWFRNVKCHLVKCPDFNIDNGIRSSKRVRFNTSVTVTCAKGFKLHGAQHLKCLANGSWTAEIPTCEPEKSCSAPAVHNRDIKHGEKSQYKPQDTVTISCKEGFDLIGSSQITCGPNGQWLNLPKCNPKGTCGPAPVYPHAHPRDMQKTEYRSGDRVHYKCNVGHRRSAGRDIIHCTNGQWTKLQLHCERKRCGSAGEIFNGRFEYSGVSFGDYAAVICDEGYELIGPAKRYCRDGGWDGRNPECEPVHCPPPPVVKNAYMSDPEYDHVPFGRVVTYRCRTGTLIGAKDIYCTKNGDWSAPPPECRDVTCPEPRVDHGSRIAGYRPVYRFGNTARITCNPGYKLADGNSINCGEDGKWKPDLSNMCVI
nr:complement receptor type 1 isoform X2 [Misgurnus anguillicaudatus]